MAARAVPGFAIGHEGTTRLEGGARREGEGLARHEGVDRRDKPGGGWASGQGLSGAIATGWAGGGGGAAAAAAAAMTLLRHLHYITYHSISFQFHFVHSLLLFGCC